MRYISIIVATVLFQNTLWAQDTLIKQIKPGTCNVQSIPRQSPFTTRGVENTTLTGPAALAKVNEMNGEAGWEQDIFQEPVRHFEKVLNVDYHQDQAFPEDGCWHKAVLSDRCDELVPGSEYKCGQICRFSFHCIDNR
jgi:hypothetical protein